MNLWWRTLLQLFRRTRRDLGRWDVGTTSFRVLPTDLDIFGIMNNGRYLSISDLGRHELLRRSGLTPEFRKRGWFAVVASATITFRKPLRPWKRYGLETRFLGVAGNDWYTDQRFVVDGEIFARLLRRVRFLQKTGGYFPIDELLPLAGDQPPTFTVQEWMKEWAGNSALPPSKSPAPSEWG